MAMCVVIASSLAIHAVFNLHDGFDCTDKKHIAIARSMQPARYI